MVPGATELSSDWYWQTDDLGQFTTVSHGVSRFGRDLLSSSDAGAENSGRSGDQHVRADQALLAARRSFRDFAFLLADASGSLRQVRLNGEPLRR